MATLIRFKEVGNSTIGKLYIDGLPALYTLEDKWRGNQSNISCIPQGTYDCVPHGWAENTPVKFKKVWRLQNVPDRSAILIHAGNTHEDTYGCILVGLDYDGNEMVLRSRDAVDLIRNHLKTSRFSLTITSGCIGEE